MIIIYSAVGFTGDQRNSSNIWWPWSNYEEWALAHTHNGFNANELRRMKPSLKHFVKPLDNKVTADKFDHIKMTLWGSTERAMTKPIEEKKHRRKGKKRKNRKKKKNNNDNNQFPISNQIPINEPSNTSYKGHSNSDNNEMDNEIRPSYNYYNSVPVVDSRKSQRNTLKRNQHLNIFLTTYLKRNFTEGKFLSFTTKIVKYKNLFNRIMQKLKSKKQNLVK